MEVGRNPPTLAKGQLKDAGIQRKQVEGRPHPSLLTEMEEKVSALRTYHTRERMPWHRPVC